ncbi:MAG: hypothetical protein JRJ87_24540 [Deltaproteobacteria bacterium]|nr:hypothetical protein [Deltaproteobacteria bacterium]
MDDSNPDGPALELDTEAPIELDDGRAASQDEEIKNRVKDVGEFFAQLKKGIKTIGLYRHNTQQYETYLQHAYNSLTETLEKYEAIQLTVEQSTFKFLKNVIYQAEAAEQNFAFRFYRDGVRLLVFRKGLTSEELLSFVLICLSSSRTSDSSQEDVISMLWKSDFEHIEYVVIESFSLGSESNDQTKVEVDQIVNYLYKRITTESGDSHQFARLSLEDLEIELDDVQQVSGIAIGKSPVLAKEREAIYAELAADERDGMISRLTDVLLDLFEEDLDQELAKTIGDAFMQIFDNQLLKEDFKGVDALFRKVRGLETRHLPAESLAWARQSAHRMLAKLAEPESIEKIADMLDSSSDKELYQLIHQYLAHLDPSTASPILHALERLNRPEARRLLCKVLAILGKEVPKMFAEKLQSPKANYVRDMLFILDTINPPDKIKYIASLVSHPNLAIRIEILKSIASSGDLTVGSYITKALKDKDAQVRATAAALLPNFDLGIAKRALMSIVQADTFAEKPDREQMAMYTALANVNDPEVMAYIRDQLHATSLLGKKKLVDHKKNIINGLANSGSIDVFRLLKAELESGVKDQELQAVMQRACKRLKERLLGG